MFLIGADILIHTATPYVYTAPDPQKDIVEPAVKGTVDAINAAIANKVKRVVVTSSGNCLAYLVNQKRVYDLVNRRSCYESSTCRRNSFNSQSINY